MSTAAAGRVLLSGAPLSWARGLRVCAALPRRQRCAALRPLRFSLERDVRGAAAGESSPSQAQPTEPPRRAPQRRTAAGQSALTYSQLLAAFKGAGSAARLRALVTQRKAPLTGELACAALLSLVRTTRLEQSPLTAQADVKCSQLLVASVGALATAGSLNPKYAAKVAWALARLKLINQRWLPDLLRAAAPEKLQARELSSLVWALAEVDSPPPATWLSALWPAVAAALPSFSAKDVGMLAYGLGTLGVQHVVPPVELRLAYETAAQRYFDACTPYELAHYLFGYTAWVPSKQLSAPWFQKYWQRANGLLTTFAPRQLANVLHCSAQLELPIQSSIMYALEEATGARIAEFRPRELAMVLSSLCKLEREPSEEWVDAYVAEVRRQLSQFDLRELSSCLWALASLRHRPSDAWLSSVAAKSQELMHQASAQCIANLIWAFAVLDARPPDSWLSALEVRAAQVLPDFTRQGLCMCCWGLVCLEAYRCGALPLLWDSLLDSIVGSPSLADVGFVDLRVVYEVSCLAAAEMPGLLTPLDGSTLEACIATWSAEAASQVSASMLKPSQTYKLVAECMRNGLGLVPAEHVVCGSSGRLIDLAIESGQTRLAVQVEGPGRCIRNTWQPSGASRMRDRALVAAGWRVVSFPFYILDTLTPSDRKEHLLRRLTEAGLPKDVPPPKLPRVQRVA